MITKTIFAGFGGQGILMMGYTLAYAAMNEDKCVTYLPSYGAEVRGGTAHCTVSVGDEDIASPIASVPDYLAIMNAPLPYCAASPGNRRKLPKPTALPATARMTPRRELHFSL